MNMPVADIATAASPLLPPRADAPPHPRGPCRRPLPEQATIAASQHSTTETLARSVFAGIQIVRKGRTLTDLRYKT